MYKYLKMLKKSVAKEENGLLQRHQQTERVNHLLQTNLGWYKSNFEFAMDYIKLLRIYEQKVDYFNEL